MKKTVILIISALLFINANAQRIRDLTIQSTQDTTAYIVIDKSTFGSYKKMQIATLLSATNKSITDIEADVIDLFDVGYSYYGFSGLNDTITIVDSTWTHVTNTDNDLFSVYTEDNIIDTGDVFTIEQAGKYNISGTIYLQYKAGYYLNIRLLRSSPSESAIAYPMQYYFGDSNETITFNFSILTAVANTKIYLQLYGSDKDDIIFKNGQLSIIQIK